MEKKCETSSDELGKLAEDKAVEFLIEKGHSILERNYTISEHNEIDIISLDGTDLVFTEVKGRKQSPYHYPESAVTPRKIASIAKVARIYLDRNPHHADVRFDVISIILHRDKPWELDHFEHAFVPYNYY